MHGVGPGTPGYVRTMHPQKGVPMNSAENDPGAVGDGADSARQGGSILDHGGVDADARAGRSLGIDPDKEPDEATKQEIAEERERRLDPENRPETAEVDNTERTFDHERGRFTDAEDYDPSEPPVFSDPENPNTREDEGGGRAEG